MEDFASKLFMKSENKSLLIRKNKIVLNFSAKFKISLSRSGVVKVVHKNDRLEAFVKVDPDSEVTNSRYIKCSQNLENK